LIFRTKHIKIHYTQVRLEKTGFITTLVQLIWSICPLAYIGTYARFLSTTIDWQSTISYGDITNGHTIN